MSDASAPLVLDSAAAIDVALATGDRRLATTVRGAMTVDVLELTP